jgi:hypothetical protein
MTIQTTRFVLRRHLPEKDPENGARFQGGDNDLIGRMSGTSLLWKDIGHVSVS